MVHKDSTAKARFEDLRSVAFGGIGAAFAVVGDPITDEAEQTTFTNNTDADVILSVDGVNGQFFYAMWSGRIVDWRSDEKVVGNRTQFYVKHNGVAPTEGAVYLEVVV